MHADDSQATRVMLEVLPFSLTDRTSFVGRDSEVSTIREVVDRALSGRGSLVMLMGEPGVGKSRLAIEIAEYASRKGFGCSIGHCYESEEPVP
jgi:predicted ATPase